VLPKGKDSLLLHSCCAPCSGDVMQKLAHAKINVTVFFYNPNIHPEEEYVLRKDENKRFSEQLGMPFIDADYDKDNWFARVKGLEMEPERGSRCTQCFEMRFERTALYASEHNFPLISSTLGISRWKDFSQITSAGLRAAERYDAIDYWTVNWRKNGGSERMIEVSKQEKFYQQQYCGCVYSLRDSNHWRMANGRQRIKRGTTFYGEMS
jgi:epoxyqueuosine reductase